MNEELIKEIQIQHELLIENLKGMDGGKACDMIKEGIDYLLNDSPNNTLLRVVKDAFDCWLQLEDEKYEREMKE